LFPERTVKAKTIMDVLSKSFSHYVKESGVEKDITDQEQSLGRKSQNKIRNLQSKNKR
jgi:hypothetical protein